MNSFFILNTKEDFLDVAKLNIQEWVDSLRKDFRIKFINTITNKVFKTILNSDKYGRSFGNFQYKLCRKHNPYDKDVLDVSSVRPEITQELVESVLTNVILKDSDIQKYAEDTYKYLYGCDLEYTANINVLKRFVRRTLKSEQDELVNLIDLEIKKAIVKTVENKND